MLAGVVAYFFLPVSQGWYSVAAVALGLLAGAAVFMTSERGRMVVAFSREARIETLKVVWPTRKDVLQTTGVIILMIAIMAVFLWLVDFGLLWLVRLIMRPGS